MKRLIVCCQYICVACLVAVVITPYAGASPAVAEQTATTVFLLRHAEKADSSEDTELSAKGKERAEALARLLKHAGIKQVHSSRYRCAMQTAEPVARLFGLKTRPYDPHDPRSLPELVTRVHTDEGPHVIVGHSNTTPNLVERLGGHRGAPIDDRTEFDRLYILFISEDSDVGTVIVRY